MYNDGMTPQEIGQLKQHSLALCEALNSHRDSVWPFLRQQVSVQYILPCERCQKSSQLLRSPYAQDLCIECLLYELLVGGPLMEDEYLDPRSRKYDADLDDMYRIPDDYDGPPIAIA